MSPLLTLAELAYPLFLRECTVACMWLQKLHVFSCLSRLRRVVAYAFGKLKCVLCFLLMGLWKKKIILGLPLQKLRDSEGL